MPEAGETEPDAREASKNNPDFWNAVWMSLPPMLGSRLVRCASTWSTACCNGGGRLFDAATAPRLANSGAWLPCWVTAVSVATATATRSSGVKGLTIDGGLAEGPAGAATGAFGVSVTLSSEVLDAPCEAGGTIASLMPLSVCDIASCR